MSARGRLGLLGGTFDPIHFGHLDCADAARTALQLDEVWLVPSRDPPHRVGRPLASPFHRVALVALAIEGRAGYRVSDMELERTGPSYTAETLRALHEDGWHPSQLFFILGSDAFAEIANWHEFPDVLTAANFVVIARPGTSLDAATARTPALRTRMRRAGRDVPDDRNPHIILVEAPVRDISSTVVRARLAADQPIDDLVPAAVARHIRTHQLYGAVGDLHDNNQGEKRE